MIASELLLTRSDIKNSRITDAYSLHRSIYDLFEDVRSEAEKKSSVSSGILYADKGGNFNFRKILIVSDREPRQPKRGQIKDKKPIPEALLQYERYGFEVIINPTKRDKNTGKIVAICGREAIEKWFIAKAPKSWGFAVNPVNFQIQSIGVQCFKKGDRTVTQSKAVLKGELKVTERERFIQSFKLGIGRGRAFGFGLLQIVPLNNKT